MIINAPNQIDLLKFLQISLLKGRSARYMRYLHLRDCIRKIKQEIDTVLVVGSGHALAELAIALEFPGIDFYITDINARGYPRYKNAMHYVFTNCISNVRFGVCNILDAPSRQFSLVCSTEVLEHIDNYQLASSHMRSYSNCYVYCLVPFAQKNLNLNLKKRVAVSEALGHVVMGFDVDSIKSMFGVNAQINGAYWNDSGIKLRNTLKTMTDNEIELSYNQLISLADSDLKNQHPTFVPDCWGVKVLAKHDDLLGSQSVFPPTLQQLIDLDSNANPLYATPS